MVISATMFYSLINQLMAFTFTVLQESQKLCSHSFIKFLIDPDMIWYVVETYDLFNL